MLTGTAPQRGGGVHLKGPSVPPSLARLLRQGAAPPGRYTLRMLPYRVGYGEDAHCLQAGLRLMLGGVEIADAPRGAVAHSDGDAALHTVADALLSGLALGDIGQYFPDTDPRWKQLDSADIVHRCLALARERGYRPANLAIVITLDQPKLGARRAEIARQIAALMQLDASEVGISFKTSEGLAPDHVQARATVLLVRI